MQNIHIDKNLTNVMTNLVNTEKFIWFDSGVAYRKNKQHNGK